MEASTLAEQRQNRLMQALKHEKPDRTPLMLNGSVAFMRYAGSEKTVADFVNDPLSCAKEFLPAVSKMENLDIADGWSMAMGDSGGAMWFSKMKLPGRELGVNDLWQLDEHAFMTRDDYDLIFENGWNWYINYVNTEVLGLNPPDMGAMMGLALEASKLNEQYGYPEWGAGVMAQSPLDKICVGRGTVNFFRDIREIPDKLKAVLEVIMEGEMENLKMMLEHAKPGGVGMVAPAIRCTCDYVSEKVFEEFVWPTMYPQADLMLEHGLYVSFHNDSNWTDFLHFWTHYPAKRCIYDSDGQTDFQKIIDILGDRMCLTGNVPPGLLSLGTPDDVYNYCRAQIEQAGDAYILSGSCTLPPNTKPENLDAMNAAVAG